MPEHYDFWNLSIKPKESSDRTFHFYLDRNTNDYKKHIFTPPIEIDFQTIVETQFQMGRTEDNSFDLILGNSRIGPTNAPVPTMNTYIYTIYWGDVKNPIYKKSYYLSNYESCQVEVFPGDQLNQAGTPGAILTYYN